MSPLSTPPRHTITAVSLDLVLGHLAPHFLTCTNGDVPAARHAASQMLAAYASETEEELRLAAAIVSFCFQALEALSQATAPELSLNETLRLRASAVSLSRESHKSQRKLDQLRRARAADSDEASAPAHSEASFVPPPALPEPPAPQLPSPSDVTPLQSPVGQPLGLLKSAREAIEVATVKGGVKGWRFSRQQHRAAKRAEAELRRTGARHGSWPAVLAAAVAESSDHHGAT